MNQSSYSNLFMSLLHPTLFRSFKPPEGFGALVFDKAEFSKFMHPENSECTDTMSSREWLRPSMLGLGFAPQMGPASNSRLEVAAECCSNHCNSFWHKPSTCQSRPNVRAVLNLSLCNWSVCKFFLSIC